MSLCAHLHKVYTLRHIFYHHLQMTQGSSVRQLNNKAHFPLLLSQQSQKRSSTLTVQAMPLTLTAAHSSRISKSSRKLKSFSFAGASQRKSNIKRSKSKTDALAEDGEDFFEDRLDDVGIVTTLATDLSLRDVVPTMNYIRSTMFDEMPTERSGMNSTRTAEVLNFRKALPPVVTNAHVHALVKSPTLVEKEIAQLINAGLIRRITIPGRGVGASSISDGLVLVKDWIRLSSEARDMIPDLRGRVSPIEPTRIAV